MELKNDFKHFFIVIFFIFLIYGCTNSSKIESKTKSESQELTYLARVTSTLPIEFEYLKRIQKEIS